MQQSEIFLSWLASLVLESRGTAVNRRYAIIPPKTELLTIAVVDKIEQFRKTFDEEKLVILPDGWSIRFLDTQTSIEALADMVL